MIVSNDSSNKLLNRVQLVRLSSKTDKLYPSEAAVVVAGKESMTMADQLTTMSKGRLSHLKGILSPEDMRKVEEAIKIPQAII